MQREGRKGSEQADFRSATFFAMRNRENERGGYCKFVDNSIMAVISVNNTKFCGQKCYEQFNFVPPRNAGNDARGAGIFAFATKCDGTAEGGTRGHTDQIPGCTARGEGIELGEAGELDHAE